MTRIGVVVTTSEIPPATTNSFSTANAFMIGLADAGASGTAYRCESITDVTNAIGPRSATNSTLWDAADVYFREGGAVLFLSRVVGPTPVDATLTLVDGTAEPTVVVSALTPGNFGNTLQVAVLVVSSTYTVNVEDSNGDILESWGPFTTTGSTANAPLLAVTSQYVSFTQSQGSGHTSKSPVAVSATSLATGTDNRGSATITNWSNALTAFTKAMGPGQVSAPGQTNTGLSGIWSALGSHAISGVNRVAVLDMDDQETASTLVSDLGSFGTSSVASYCGFWGGQVIVPGPNNTPGVSRTVPASPVISALCARADAAGNPNQAAAGEGFPLNYVSGFTGALGVPLYDQSDIDTLNVAGINTWNNIFGVLQNYGFTTSVNEETNSIDWQFNHARLRMALVALAEEIGQPFVFDPITQLIIKAFSGKLAQVLSNLVTVGAISTIAPDGSTDQGFTIDTGSSVNTAVTMAAGELNANVNYRPTPFAELITINLNAIPTTASL